MSLVWDVLYFLGLTLASPVLLYRMVRQGKYRSRIPGRLGMVRVRRRSRPCLWVHGVSVGEVLASRTLITGFRTRHPDWDVVVSTTTDTGFETARRTLPDCLVITYPLDFTASVTQALSQIRPSAVVLMELELWPNFVRICVERGVPVIIANGRLSARGARLQRAFRFVLSGSYRQITRICAQTEEYARRFRSVGAPPDRISVTGSLKYDSAPARAPVAAGLRAELGIDVTEKLIVAGSTCPGEEEILLDVYARLKKDFPDVRLAIVPRHPERFDAVASLIRARSFKCLRRSAPRAQGAGPGTVILGDTMGELVRFYALAEVVFVGKSLVRPGGGQNLMEPAALGKPVLFGPHTANFQETRDLLLARDAAVEVTDAAGFETATRKLLADGESAARMGERARRVIDAARGATERTLDVIEEVLASKAKPV